MFMPVGIKGATVNDVYVVVPTCPDTNANFAVSA